jgi:hypothetical protein
MCATAVTLRFIHTALLLLAVMLMITFVNLVLLYVQISSCIFNTVSTLFNNSIAALLVLSKAWAPVINQPLQ